MQNLTSGFYHSQYVEEKITLIKKQKVEIFYTGGNLEILLDSEAKLTLYAFPETPENNLKILHAGEKSSSDIRVIPLSDLDFHPKMKILSEIDADFCETEVQIVAMIHEYGNANIDGNVKINENLKATKGFLHQENLMLAAHGKVRWVPQLFISSDDVEAGHSCSIEGLDEEKMFYLQSRWIPTPEAKKMIIESYLDHLFWDLQENHEDLYQKIQEKTLSYLKSPQN